MTRHLDDDGSGTLGAVFGVTIFLFFVFFACQLLFSLFARSSVTNVAYNGARSVAGHRAERTGGTFSPVTLSNAEDRMRQQLGQVGQHAQFDWSGTTMDEVSLRVQVDAPRFMSLSVLGPLATDHIDRTVLVRVEYPR